jgi:hypothetical protein
VRKRTALARGLDPEVVDLGYALTNTRVVGAVSPSDSHGALVSAWLKFDLQDSVVTSPSSLGFTAGQRFLEILDQPGTALADTPIPLP